MKSYTETEVREIARNSLGKTLGELQSGSSSYIIHNEDSKSFVGYVMEESVFNYRPNPSAKPDFEEAKIELKTTPYRKNQDGSFSAKERLVLNIINYMKEYEQTFETSSFYSKNSRIQLMWYLYEAGKQKKDLRITHELFLTFPENDLLIIKNDWEVIVNKIRAGKAHEISESDTMYLGACTKGVNSSSVRRQPFSNILAKQRAFSLKVSYMTQLVRNHIGRYQVEYVLPTKMVSSTFEDYIQSTVKRYVGHTESQLKQELSIDTTAKNVFEIIFARMLGINGKVADTDEFRKANIVPKTIRLEENGTIRESMSFPAFQYRVIAKQKWENSQLRKMFSETKFCFVVFAYNGQEYAFSRVVFWNLPYPVLENDIRSTWEKTKKVITSGNIVREISNGKYYTNFPGIKENKYCHVRPHAKDSSDVFPLPVRDSLTGKSIYTKHCFWLNSAYVSSIIEVK